MQIKTTFDILKYLKVLDKPIITVFNKMDKANFDNLIYDSSYVDKKIFISAQNSINLNELLHMIQDNIPVKYRKVSMVLPYTCQSILSYLLDKYSIDYMEHKEDGVHIRLDITMDDYERYKTYIV